MQRGDRDEGHDVDVVFDGDVEAANHDVIMKPIIFTLMFTGLRSGELLALRWDNLDFHHGTLTVDSAVAIAPEYDGNGSIQKRVSVLSIPKTEAGFRTIKLPAFVSDVLLDWKLYIDYKKPEHDHFVFCSTKTGDMRSYQGFKASFRHFLERNKLTEQNITPHMFRHTFASMLLENNVNPRVVQRLLGHADIQTTLGIYSHVMKEVYSGVAEALDGIYAATVAGTYQPMVGNGRMVQLMEQDSCSAL